MDDVREIVKAEEQRGKRQAQKMKASAKTVQAVVPPHKTTQVDLAPPVQSPVSFTQFGASQAASRLLTGIAPEAAAATAAVNAAQSLGDALNTPVMGFKTVTESIALRKPNGRYEDELTPVSETATAQFEVRAWEVALGIGALGLFIWLSGSKRPFVDGYIDLQTEIAKNTSPAYLAARALGLVQ